jgi:ABC-type polysaccharide/polyol phosphate transport system ATPase subunit
MATSAPPAVLVEGVSKRFTRGERHDSLRDLIPALLRRARGSDGPQGAALGRDEFWAVRDLTFEVEFGRALGIIGPNGAGKSTTLKLLTGILRPTTGEIRMRGRVASLIEVSAGFHQDLTGRENVYLQGAIMGMTRQEVGRRLDSIVDFSGIEAFIDTPVKRYSSGMNARLGFAIAVHLDPDVLVIDEVLSVGDMAFQAKCTDRMKAFKRDGVAIVFVSHNMQAVGELCDEAIVIKGHPRFQGAVGQAVQQYLSIANHDGDTRGGDGVRLEGVHLVDAQGEPAIAVTAGAPLRLTAELTFQQPIGALVYGMVVYRATDGLRVADVSFSGEEYGIPSVAAGDRVRLTFDHVAHLARGQYTYEINVWDAAQTYHRLLTPDVAGVRVDEYRSWAGVADLEVRIGAERESAVAAAALAG